MKDIKDLSLLQKYILIHIYRFGPDTPWLMAHRLLGNYGYSAKYDPDEIEENCKILEKEGLLIVYKGELKMKVTSSVKPWLKVKSKEFKHKPPGIYYDLSKDGRKIASNLYKEMFKNK